MEEYKIAQPIGYYFEVIPSKLIDLILEEIDKINQDDLIDASVGGIKSSEIILPKIRNSKVHWWYDTHWVTSLISHYFNKINRDFWEYDLTYLDGIQVTTYFENDHYTWHCDYGVEQDSNQTRKISMSLLVSDSDDYEGGDLEFIDYHGNKVSAPREKGTMIFFDSRIPHRVTPVTKGKRVSLVAWMFGPKLK